MKCIKRVKGKRGGPDRTDLLVKTELVSNYFKKSSDMQINKLLVKYEDVVMPLNELNVVMKCLGQRLTGRDLHLSSLHSALHRETVAAHGEICE